MHTQARPATKFALDNSFFDLSTCESVDAKDCHVLYRHTTLVLIAQAVFLLEYGQTHTLTQTPITSDYYVHAVASGMGNNNYIE